MRVIVQRVLEAKVLIAGEVVASIGAGLLLLAGFGHTDTLAVLESMAKKIVGLRIFSDTDDRLQYDVAQVQGAILAVPQFTLYAGLGKGRRPNFAAAMEPADATVLFDQFVVALRHYGSVPVSSGVFGAAMQVVLANDGPFTLILEK